MKGAIFQEVRLIAGISTFDAVWITFANTTESETLLLMELKDQLNLI